MIQHPKGNKEGQWNKGVKPI